MKTKVILTTLLCMLLTTSMALSVNNTNTYRDKDNTQVMWYTPGKYSVTCFYQLKNTKGTFVDGIQRGYVQCKSHRARSVAWIEANGDARSRTKYNNPPSDLQKSKAFKPIKSGWRMSWKKTGVSCSYTNRRMLCSTIKKGIIRGFVFDNKGRPSVMYLNSKVS